MDISMIFDLSDVFIWGVNGASQLIARNFGRSISRKCFIRLYETRREFYELLRGHLTEDEYFRIFFARYIWPFKTDDLRQAFFDGFKKRIPNTFETYLRIWACPQSFEKNSKIIVGRPKFYIVSDHIEECIDEIMSCHPDIFALAEDVIWSCRVGKIKRDAGFFPELLARLELPPEKAVFIDDSNTNVAAAKKAGITSIRFRNAEKLETDLKELGFKFS